ncbi:MAG: glycosyltransferase family 9 protein [FCB group bacterium]|nr:glycosyltransferase family 9 protein [FCB group bacterium]
MNNVTNILILQGGPKKDVLRSTCLLEPLKQKFGNSKITWVTRHANSVLLHRNSLVNSVLSIEDGGTTAALLNRGFQRLYSLDLDNGIGDLANLIRSPEKFGLFIDNNGSPYVFNPEARALLDYQNNNLPSKFNFRRTVMKSAGLKGTEPGEMILNISESGLEYAQKFLTDNSLRTGDKPLIIVYLGTGLNRPPVYPDSKSISFITEELTEKLDAEIILTGGPREKPFYDKFFNACPPRVISGGCEAGLFEFLGLISKCDLFIGMDSLALHAALALEKKVIALQNPRTTEDLELCCRGLEVASQSIGTSPEGRESVSYNHKQVIKAAAELLKL